MADLDAQVADHQAKLAELHAAFSTKLDTAAAAHRAECAARDSELRVRERLLSDKLRLLSETDAALKERAIALDRQQQGVMQRLRRRVRLQRQSSFSWRLKLLHAQKLPRASGEN
jgi:hypothetical protein